MTFLILGFLTGLSLILAIGAQNVFVIEQGLKREYIFIVCLICSLSDFILIFFGIFLFEFFKEYFTVIVQIFLNILLFIFLIFFVYSKIKYNYAETQLLAENKKTSFKTIVFKTIAFTYLNPHVYSDTVFFLGNFSKNFILSNKYLFGIGATLSSFLFFFTIGYLSKYLSNYLNNLRTWKIINTFIIIFMSSLSLYVLFEIYYGFSVL